MQKWEYKIINIQWGNDKRDGPIIEAIDGQPTSGAKQGFIDYLNNLGAEGWELILYQPHWTYLFKRPKQ
jgi:hypothetical protein